MTGIFNGNPAFSQAEVQDKKAYNYQEGEYPLAHDSIRL